MRTPRLSQASRVVLADSYFSRGPAALGGMWGRSMLTILCGSLAWRAALEFSSCTSKGGAMRLETSEPSRRENRIAAKGRRCANGSLHGGKVRKEKNKGGGRGIKLSFWRVVVTAGRRVCARMLKF